MIGYPLVVVEPIVNVNGNCRAVFKINSQGTVGVGVCVPNIVAANSYKIKGSFSTNAVFSDKHGTFVIWNDGTCFTHGNPKMQTALTYFAGESVSVEWDWVRKEVVWRVLGTDKSFSVSVPSQYLQGPLHFVVAMRDSDVSVIA